MHDAPWDAEALNRRRLERWQAHPYLGPHAGGVLIVDETGDPKRGQRIVLAAQHSLGKLGSRGHVANGVVAVTSQWADGSRHVPLSRHALSPGESVAQGQERPALPHQAAVGMAPHRGGTRRRHPLPPRRRRRISGENAALEAKLFAAKASSIIGLKPSHGTWHLVEDPEHPPAFTPAAAARRLPLDAWERTVRFDNPGKERVRSSAERELGTIYGPTRGVRLIAATLDPQHLKPESTWYLATSFPVTEVSAEQVDEISRLRDWIEHYYQPAKHELSWAD
jgi:hypothetical protein